MKSNLRVFCEWALITSVLMSFGFFVWFLVKSHAARTDEVQIARAQFQYQQNHQFLNALGMECQQYAKTNAEFARFLASLNQPAPAAPGKTATR